MSSQKNIRARQINIVEVSEKIGEDSTAINNIATGIADDSTAILTIATGVLTDPSAIALFDGNYFRIDGTNSMLGDINVGTFNIVNVGNVDGRDISADGVTLDNHVGDATLHFIEGDIDHSNIQNSGTNTHAQIDTHITDATNPHSTSILNLSDVVITTIGTNNTLIYNGSNWVNQTTVVSFNTRTGEVIPESGDYTASEIVNVPLGGITSTDLQAAINELDVGKSNTTHSHNLDDLTNVIAPSPSTSDGLFFNGSNWVTGPISGGGGFTDHDDLFNNGGVGSHAAISAHMGDPTIHFSEGSISHLNISDIGVNTHTQIDAHIADSSVHFTTLAELSDTSLLAPTNQQVLTFTTAGNLWVPTTVVNSFNGRSGTVMPVSGDYPAASITSVPTATLLSANTQSALNELDTNNIALATRVTTTETDIDIINNSGPVGQTFVQSTPFPIWTIIHNRNTRNFVYTILDTANNAIIPNAVDATDMNELVVTFNIAIAGRMNVMFYS